MPIRSRPEPLPARMPHPRDAYATRGEFTSPEPVLLAANARTARRPRQCVACRRPILPGERLADLPGRDGVVHVAGCSARA